MRESSEEFLLRKNFPYSHFHIFIIKSARTSLLLFSLFSVYKYHKFLILLFPLYSHSSFSKQKFRKNVLPSKLSLILSILR